MWVDVFSRVTKSDVGSLPGRGVIRPRCYATLLFLLNALRASLGTLLTPAGSSGRDSRSYPGPSDLGSIKFLEASYASFWSQHTAPTSLTSESNEGNAWTALARRLISQFILFCTLLARAHVACSRGKSR